MDKLEYIPGDLVMIEMELIKSRIVKVSKVDVDNVIYCEDWGDVWFHDEIKPIPLTPGILEKNGWKRTQIFMDNDGFEFHIYVDDERCLDLQYYPQYKKFSAFICEQEILPDIEYVHQLQHILFGLGINHEMEV